MLSLLRFVLGMTAALCFVAALNAGTWTPSMMSRLVATGLGVVLIVIVSWLSPETDQ